MSIFPPALGPQFRKKSLTGIKKPACGRDSDALLRRGSRSPCHRATRAVTFLYVKYFGYTTEKALKCAFLA